uniref:PPM-type phosphatase domain-containing protein n=1 Tax=Caenorhabditis tropicalis TaxID=1561998 RepID=A0A1I7UJP1_9PELO
MDDASARPSSSAIQTEGEEESEGNATELPIKSDSCNHRKPTLEQIKMERDTLFLDLFSDRQRSARAIIEEAFQEELLKHGEEPQNQLPTAVPVRFRHPPVAGPIHDVFGDCMHTIFQKLMSRGVSVEYSHWMSYWIALEIDEDIGLSYREIKFDKDVYTTENSTEVKRKFSEKVWPTVEKIIWMSANNCKILEEKWTGIHVSADQMKGQRHKQEDRFVAYPNGQYINRGPDPVSLLAVFDGHGGHECSQYAAAHMWETWQYSRQTDADLCDQLVSALKFLDERMTERNKKEHWKGGTTAVCCAIDMEQKIIAFAWLGDSPGYIMSNLEFRKFTREHSPSDPDEARRVEANGGQLFVIGGELRVNGVLNLTRALGDVAGRPMISNQAESFQKTIDASDYLVLLACDGISDVLNTSDLYNLVQAFVHQYPVEEYNDLARFICNEAISAGSADNVTIVIGFLRSPEDVWRVMRCVSDDENSDTDSVEVDKGLN